MAQKYYAVRKGKTTGIYRTWDACKAQVDGVPYTEYKSFQTEQEARDYLGSVPDLAGGKKAVGEKTAAKKTMGSGQETATHPQGDDGASVKAYVDGSYNKITREFSYGMIVLRDGQELKYAEKYNDPELALMHNVAGEIKGAEAAMRYAVEQGLDAITIYHDYEGIAKWCLGAWKTNKDGTKAYKAYYDSIRSKVAVRFVKVTGHSNDKYNDIADELAKQALGLH